MCGIWAIFGSDGKISFQCNSVHKISHRGPDAFRIENINHFPNSCLAFHRLAIVDDLCGMQPMRTFQHPYIYLIYNGEIYNFKELREEFGFHYDTECDGESIIHLYAKGGIEFAAKHLDGVFAFCLMDTANRNVYLGRDTFGVRPAFRITTVDGFLAVCSEAKGLVDLSYDNDENHATSQIEPLLPGHVETYSFDMNGRAFLTKITRFNKIGETPAYPTLPVPIGDDVKENIRSLLNMGVRKRLMADRRIGCLLSGGLDSSLVTALVVKLAKEIGLDYKIQTFSIGMEGSTDLAAAKKVADYLDTEHHEIVFTPEQGVEAVDNVIYHLESYDTTTVRASVGMYLVSQYIREKTDTTVILSGEGSDEITEGYIYFHKAPSGEAASEESRHLCNDLYMFDVLRADRTTAAWGGQGHKFKVTVGKKYMANIGTTRGTVGTFQKVKILTNNCVFDAAVGQDFHFYDTLEVRVPFLDHRFSSYYMSLSDKQKLPVNGIEKHLLRSAFSDQGLLPDEILWRPKEEFSDGLSSVKKTLYEVLQSHIDEQINDEDLKKSCEIYTHNSPTSKESLHYRKLFEKYYPGMGKWIPYFWMPKWIESTDPSARALKHYKQSTSVKKWPAS